MVTYNLPLYRQTVDSVLSISEVVSVGEGLRNGERVIVVGVEDSSVRSQIPNRLDGLPVVVEVQERPGLTGAKPPLAPPEDVPTLESGKFTSKFRPVQPGVSIGHPDVTAGTASFLATDGESLYQFSNNHVLANSNNAQVGDPILQPGAADGGAVPGDVAGSLTDWVPLDQSDNQVDLAWYEPEVKSSAGVVNHATPASSPVQPVLGEEITFVGRTSGVKTATVDRTNVVIEVGNTNPRRFVNQFRIDAPFLGGDSGAPVTVTRNGTAYPAGIGYAATSTQGWCMYATSVVEESGLRFVSADPTGDVSVGNGRLKKILAAGAIGLVALSR